MADISGTQFVFSVNGELTVEIEPQPSVDEKQFITPTLMKDDSGHIFTSTAIYCDINGKNTSLYLTAEQVRLLFLLLGIYDVDQKDDLNEKSKQDKPKTTRKRDTKDSKKQTGSSKSTHS